MIRYIADRKNLQLIMNLLRDKSHNIQFEAFHVFKVWGDCCCCYGSLTGFNNVHLLIFVTHTHTHAMTWTPQVFVANPKKPVDIVTILYNNKDKIVAYLDNFHLDRDDTQFLDEKKLLIE
jgi:calcium binding protein 39